MITHMCISNILGSELEPDLSDTWIFGVPFLKNVYTVFDVLDKHNPKIGFAPSL